MFIYIIKKYIISLCIILQQIFGVITTFVDAIKSAAIFKWEQYWKSLRAHRSAWYKVMLKINKFGQGVWDREIYKNSKTCIPVKTNPQFARLVNVIKQRCKGSLLTILWPAACLQAGNYNVITIGQNANRQHLYMKQNWRLYDQSRHS